LELRNPGLRLLPAIVYQFKKDKTMKGALLIIGSLLWDSDKNENIGFRKNWRQKRLIVKNKILVKAPIRYGKLSGNNEVKNYTMVFSNDCEKENLFGTAYLVPFKNQNIKTYRGIENQARYLSDAEGGVNDKLCKGNYYKWATIGILINPKIAIEEKNKMLLWWKDLLKKDGGLLEYQDYKVDKEESILSDKGELLIKWLQPLDKTNIDAINEFDFVLATCTKPNIPKYPSVEELALDILKDKRKYFFLNFENGITTFQDRDILNE
jgi:hypothetical protein